MKFANLTPTVSEVDQVLAENGLKELTTEELSDCRFTVEYAIDRDAYGEDCRCEISREGRSADHLEEMKDKIVAEEAQRHFN